MGQLRDEFRTGIDSARIKSHGDGILRGVLVGIAVVIALWSPVSLWLKVVIFLGSMFVIGAVVQALKRRRP